MYVLKVSRSILGSSTNGMNNYAAKMNEKTKKENNGQLVTGGIFYCRYRAGFSVSASNKFSCNLTGQCSEIGNKKHTANRVCLEPIRQEQLIGCYTNDGSL